MNKILVSCGALILCVLIMSVGSCVSSKAYQEERTKRSKANKAYCLEIYKLKPNNVPRLCN